MSSWRGRASTVVRSGDNIIQGKTMGLDDIDECAPPYQGTLVTGEWGEVLKGKSVNKGNGSGGPSAPVQFGDLFGGPVFSNSTNVVSSGSGVVGGVRLGSSSPCHESSDPWAWTSSTSQQQDHQQRPHTLENNISAASNDPLDTFFTTSVPSAQPPTSVIQTQNSPKNLFDFSQPAVRVRHSDEHSLLEAFENQSKGRRADVRDGPSLAVLSQGSSNNVVKARLLKIMNYYDILGVTRDATEQQIRQKYKRKALELHPDRAGRNQTPEEMELFKVMTKAQEVLCDAEERAKYDEELRCSNVCESDEARWLFHLRPQ
ncbi:DnaJ chaperone protein [Trypanosoma rangeli]|uniref:DnaJ chaperone protein n=1 Tax=Trypanosoma rangeli TaxID=5698 RepID=A0A3R7KQV9_TRYRA|nr:DnaJ chaperone protein [Trypanosoma rangeli]RNF11826.1 DnaJ chaperone protein [Trypanosoma rangeli]|eukprot:RNF11826.1 DnaJ chaperone protein [Trypanosoma rangeli]